MNIRKLNWPAWLGLILCIFGLVSYPFIFVNWPVTRDFPWANLLIFAGAFLLLIVGIRRRHDCHPGRVDAGALPVRRIHRRSPIASLE